VGSRLSVARHGDILLIALESEDGFPRLERRILAEIEAQVAKLAGTHALAGTVITGTERAFAVGAEISELANLTPASAFKFARRGQSMMRAIANSPKPIVAAIRGYCMGGGFDLCSRAVRESHRPMRCLLIPAEALGSSPGGAELSDCRD
jgi:enoyl-CoA hydratase